MPTYAKPTEYPEWGSGLTVIPGWNVSTAYTAGDFVSNAGAIYECTTSGTSAASGTGPASTATSITDGTAVWRYSHPAFRAGPAVEPSTYQKANGLPPEQILPSGTLNWLFLTIWQWLRYLGSFVAQSATWTAPQSFTQTLSATNPPGTAWQSSTAYAVDDIRTNDSGKIYIVTTAGTSASSGGPTGTGSAITDGTVVWKYLRSAAPAVLGTSSTTGQPGVSGVATAGNADGVSGQGFGTGSGVAGTGGATGAGMTGTGGATSGVGGAFTATAGNSAGATGAGNGSGAGVAGTGGATGFGVLGTGGASGAAGVRGVGTVDNPGGSFQGQGTGDGLTATGGDTGDGGTFSGGATSGAGVVATGTGGGNGATTTGQGAGAGILATGGATGVGVDGVGSLAAAGVRATPFLNLVPTASAPSAPANGDMWYDSGSHTIKVRLNGATVTITTA